MVALPYAGAAGHAFGPLRDRLRAVDLRPIDYPGRGRRFAEPCATSPDALVEDAVERILATAGSGAFAVLGHSLGALVAHRASLALARAGRPPALVVVSGARPPGRRDEEELHRLPDDALVERLDRLGGDGSLADPELRAMFLPVIRADLALAQAFGTKPPLPLPVPLVALRGAEDDDCPSADARAWARLTESSFDYHELPGRHFFLLREAVESAATVLDQRCRALDPAGGSVDRVVERGRR
jgi:surfactin synthase thioesterase subunit